MNDEELTKRLEALGEEYASYIMRVSSYERSDASLTNDVKFYLLEHATRYHELINEFCTDLFFEVVEEHER